MYSEINVSVEDGNLGRNTGTSTHAQVKIGVSAAEASSPILISNSMKPAEIRAKLGDCPLADACIDATENGLETIYALPVKAGTEGTAGKVTHTGDGAGSITVSGKPGNAFDIVIRITEAGGRNTGCFRFSVDGGNSFSGEYTIPEDGAFAVPGTGVTVTFTAGEGTDAGFADGDDYAFRTTAPAMSNADVLDAVSKLAGFNKDFEVCHIVGTSTGTLWAALSGMAEEFLTIHKKPFLFLCEARPCAEDENPDAYLAAMEAERKGISSYFISVCLTYATYIRKDLRTQDINMAGVLSGLIGRTKESLSVGCVEECPISCAKLLKLLPDGIGEYSRKLDEAGYTVFRQYSGKEDYYVSNANVMAPAGSDFAYVESVRVLCRIIRAVSAKATDKIQCEIDPGNLEGSVGTIEAYLNIAIEDCLRDKIISSGAVTIDTKNLNILADETLDVDVTWVPMGTARRYNISFAVSNPASGV